MRERVARQGLCSAACDERWHRLVFGIRAVAPVVVEQVFGQNVEDDKSEQGKEDKIGGFERHDVALRRHVFFSFLEIEVRRSRRRRPPSSTPEEGTFFTGVAACSLRRIRTAILGKQRGTFELSVRGSVW